MKRKFLAKRSLFSAALMLGVSSAVVGCGSGNVANTAVQEAVNAEVVQESTQEETQQETQLEDVLKAYSEGTLDIPSLYENMEWNFDTKIAMREGEDGWIYFFYCEYTKGAEIPYAYVFEGYKLNDDEEAVYKVPFLYADGENVSDLNAIQAFFNSEQPTSALTQEQVDKLTLTKIDKNLVVELFNEAITSDFMPDGKYPYVPEADIWTEDVQDGYRWQVGYFVSHGVVMSVDIELAYEDGTYLSDIIDAGNGTEEQNKLAELVAQIEAYIVDEQQFVIPEEVCKNMDEDDIGRIAFMLDGIVAGKYY